MHSTELDAAIIGSGPNGLAAAIRLAHADQSVVVFEAAETIGGGTRSAELTLPGFTHDVCSAIHPLGLASPFFRSLPLHQYGLRWIQPQIQLAHPLDDGRAVLLTRDLGETAAQLGDDEPTYRRLIQPFVRNWERLLHQILGPLRLPKYPLLLARFGLLALRSTTGLVSRFRDPRSRALFAGLAGHSMMPLESPLTSAFALTMGTLGHAIGWPIAAGGSQAIADALHDHLRSRGGVVVTGTRIRDLEQLPVARAILFDTAPLAMVQIAGTRLPSAYRRRLERYRFGPGVFKVDWALDGPVPWKAQGCSQAGTVHIGGTLQEIASAERAVWQGRHPERPFVIFAQPSLFDAQRAPSGRHIAWGYCHVPNGSREDMTDRIEAQLERFAPGFQDRILARHTRSAAEMESYNANYVGGDINVGVQDLRQVFTRPVPRLSPYSTPARDLFLCSSATPPGGGVHGMCGFHAAEAALRRARWE